MKRTGIILLLGLTIVSCKKEVIKPVHNCPAPSENQYLFLSHTRNNDLHLVDKRVENIDFSQFSGLLLGGDISYQSSMNDATINGLNDIFNLASENTLWALGNHDISDRSLIQSITGRNSYYAYYKNGTTFIVLDTEIENSSITGAQLSFYNSVVDTISVSKNVILLHHKLMWMQGNTEMESMINDVSNGEAGTCGYCLDENNFYDDIYPKLVDLKNDGKNVYCLGGDVGGKVSYFTNTSPDGVEFIANGISYMNNNAYGLVITQSAIDSNLTFTKTAISCLY